MHASESLCVYALEHVSACTQGDMPPGFFWKYIPQSEVKLILASHPSLITLCVHPCVCLCVCVYACIMCSAGPEVAVLYRYGPEADPVYWRRGRGGGGCRTSGSV